MKFWVPNKDRPRPPEAVYAEATKEAGRHIFGLLLAEESWIHRRVETIDMLSTQFLRRSVSVDFTLPEGAVEALAIGRSGQTLVPLATLAKRPLRNFDLRDEGGAAVPVLGRDHNGSLAESTLVGVARRALDDAGGGEPSQGLIENLRQVAIGDAGDAERAIADIVRAARAGNSREHQVVLEDDAALFMLADLAGNYVLVALCDDVSKRRVLKFSYEEPLEIAGPGVLEWLGWRPLLVEMEVPGVSRTASYHAEVVIPEELRFEACLLYDMDTDEVYAEDEEADRAALHAARIPLGARTALLFGLRAERAGFPVMGCVIAWITGLLLLGGVVVGDLDPDRADSAASVLLAASAVFAGVVARSGEHRFVQALFAGPRLLLVTTAVSALCAAGALAYGLSSCAVDIIWSAAAGISLVVAMMLTVTFFAARPIAPGK